MSKALKSIWDFSTWIVNDKTNQWSAWFANMIWLDIHTEQWVAQPNVKPLVETTTWLNENPNVFVQFDGKMLSWMDDEEIWYESTANTWTLLHTNGNGWNNNDLIVYNNYLLFSSNTRLWRSTNTTIAWGFTDSPTWWSGSTYLNWDWQHFFKLFNNRIYITDGNVLAELDWASAPTTPASWIFTQSIFRLPEGEVMLSLEVIWGQLAIGTQAGNLYIWDGASDNSSTIIKTQFWGITAMIQIENTLFVFAWLDGTIYRYNGTDLIPVIQVPDMVSTSSGTYVRKNWVKRYKNGMMFGLSLNGLYVFNRVKEWDSFSLTKYWNLSWSVNIKDSFVDVLSLYNIPWTVVSWDTIFIWYDVSGAEKIDRITDSNGLYSDALLETIEYQLRNNKWKPSRIQWVQLMFRSLISSPVTVKYKTDYNNTFTTLGTIDHTGFWADSHDTILRWISQRADKIVFRLEWLTGKLINLKIF